MTDDDHAPDDHAPDDDAPDEYADRWVRCTPAGIELRGYYFPWGTKHVRWDDIRAVRRVRIGPATGRGRVWGSTNPRYWAGLDPDRPAKRVALLLDLGRRVQPFVTPDDPEAVVAAVRARTGLDVEDVDGRGPLI